MTRKDYELIARSLRDSIADIRDFNIVASRDDIDEIVSHITENVASALQSDNPRFYTARFLKACGV
jgi:hypothetical protein